MSLRVAVVGKGGSGKSTVAGTLARVLGRAGDRVLALDSDPMPGLAISLGLGKVNDAMLAPAVEQDLNGRWHLKRGIGAARAVQRYALAAPDGVRLLQFGKADSTGLGTMWASAAGLNQVARRIATDGVLQDWSVIGDLSAGTRQTAFDWAPYADRYLIVVEPTWKSVLTGRRLLSLARDRGATAIEVVVNKATDEGDADFVSEQMTLEPALVIPVDEAVAEAERKCVAVIDLDPASSTVSAVEGLAAKLSDQEGDRMVGP